jgi:hypothetical protein
MPRSPQLVRHATSKDGGDCRETGYCYRNLGDCLEYFRAFEQNGTRLFSEASKS